MSISNAINLFLFKGLGFRLKLVGLAYLELKKVIKNTNFIADFKIMTAPQIIS